MPGYTAPVKDMQFLLHDVLKISEADIPGYSDLDRSFTEAVFDEAAKPHFGVRPEAGVEVERVPAFKEESAPGAYYSPPALGDRGRAGREVAR